MRSWRSRGLSSRRFNAAHRCQPPCIPHLHHHPPQVSMHVCMCACMHVRVGVKGVTVKLPASDGTQSEKVVTCCMHVSQASVYSRHSCRIEMHKGKKLVCLV